MKYLTLASLLFAPALWASNHTLDFGSIHDIWTYEAEYRRDLGDYKITRVQAFSEASAEGATMFGQWKNCYSDRNRISPPPIFGPRYRYTPKSARATQRARITGENTVTLSDLANVRTRLAADLDRTTHGECDISVKTHVLVEFELKSTKQKLKYEVFIEKDGYDYVFRNFGFDFNGRLEETRVIIDENGTSTPIDFATYPSKRPFSN